MKYFLKYAGSKPLISQHGITFDHSKEDRYDLLKIVVCLIEKLEHLQSKIDIKFDCDESKISDDLVLDILKNHIPNLDGAVKKAIEEFLKEEEKEKVHINNMQISEDEKRAWIKNIEIMHELNIQREINKALYHEAIKFLSREIVEDHLKLLTIPLKGRYSHIVKSLENIFEHIYDIDVESRICHKDDELIIKIFFKRA